MKIALSQINTATGDVDYNCTKILRSIEHAKKQHADLVVFPELALPGYPPKDFMFQRGWLEKQDQKIQEIVQASQSIHVIVGVITSDREHLFNSALWIDREGKKHIQTKVLLPNQDVFDEKRYFDAGSQQEVWEIEDQRIGLSVCEDLWSPVFLQYKEDPIANLAKQQPSIMINISASPFVAGKDQIRKELIDHHQKKHACPFLYLNLVGGNDELVFDGGSFISIQDQGLVSQAKAFEEDVLMWDTDHPSQLVHAYPTDPMDQKKQAIVLGLKDFVRKSGFNKVVLGLSGGVDSAVVACLAVDALGASNVYTVFMPTEFTRSISQEDAKTIADNLGTTWIHIPMDGLKNTMEKSMSDAMGADVQSITSENLQARLRGNILMSVSSEKQALVLQTGNKSEIALGYCTLYGDMVGAISPIGDLYKHEVYAIGRSYSDIIPHRVFERAPSAELREDQEDTDSLPPYDVVDPIVRMCIEEQKSVSEVVASGFDQEIVEKLYQWIENQEFKRKQAPPIVKVSSKAFGVGRRMAVAKRGYEN